VDEVTRRPAVTGGFEHLAGQDGAARPLVFGELVEARGGVAGVLGGLSGDVIEQAVDQQGESARAAAPIAPIQPVRGIHGRGIEVAVGGADPDRLVEDDLGEWAGRGEPLRDRGRGLSVVGVDDPLTDAPVGAGKRVRIDTVGDVNSGWTHPAARPLLGAPGSKPASSTAPPGTTSAPSGGSPRAWIWRLPPGTVSGSSRR